MADLLNRLKNWWKPEPVKRVVCPACNGTGQKDKVDRGCFAPGDCEPCLTSGWVNPATGRR